MGQPRTRSLLPPRGSGEDVVIAAVGTARIQSEKDNDKVRGYTSAERCAIR